MSAATSAVQEQKPVIIRLDPSKTHSTVHGDRTPDDPHYRVHYWQGGLPFDAEGVLIPDDGRRQVTNGVDSESKPVRFQMLYDDKKAALLARKIERATKHVKTEEPEEVTRESEEAEKQLAAEEVNFVSWLTGEAQYEPWMLFKACETRFASKQTKLKDLIEFLVLDEKVIPEDRVAPAFKKLLPTGTQE